MHACYRRFRFHILHAAVVASVSLALFGGAPLHATDGLSPGPAGTQGERDYRVPLTWISKPANFTPGDYGRWLYVGDRYRYYEAHLPENYQAGTPLPVVMVLHGGGGYAAFMRYQTGMDELADEQDFIVIYPAGSHQFFFDRGLFWNTGVAPVNQRQKKVDDVAYIHAVLDDAQKNFSIDTQRVYACGMSNGAQMCFMLASKMSDRIAAIGEVGGQRSVGQYSPAPTRAMPLIAFHGTYDFWSPFWGASIPAGFFEPYEVDAARETIASWTDFNDCAGQPLKTSINNAHGLAYRGDADVVYWELTRGGHTWPGGKCSLTEEKLGVGEINPDINASQLMWEFFRQQSLGE